MHGHISEAHGLDVQGHGTQAFVRRRSQEALSDIHHVRIDWRKTLELNLLVHSEYTLTVAACSYDALHIHRLQDDCPDGPGLTQVICLSQALNKHATCLCPSSQTNRFAAEGMRAAYLSISCAFLELKQDLLSCGRLP